MKLSRCVLFLVIGGMVISLFFSLPASAQSPAYRVTIQNQLVVTGGIFQFDVYVLRTGSTSWRIADATFQLTYNDAGFTSDSVTYLSGSTDLAVGYTISPDINNPSNTRINIEIQSPTTYSGSTETSNVGDGTKIGTFRVKTISDLTASMNLAWRTPILTRQAMLQRLSDNNVDEITSDTSYVPPTNSPLPIQLAGFAATLVRDNEVEVTWQTVSETNNYGFEIQRKRGEAGIWAKVGFVEGHGTTLAAQSYSYTDKTVSFGKYYYRITQIDLDGKAELLPEMEVNVGVGPDKFVLAQNYPNPFNPSTLIDFVVPQTGFATMKVYNVLGEEVVALFEGDAEAGKIYTARFDASRLSSGLYFYSLRSAGKVETKRMLLLK